MIQLPELKNMERDYKRPFPQRRTIMKRVSIGPIMAAVLVFTSMLAVSNVQAGEEYTEAIINDLNNLGRVNSLAANFTSLDFPDAILTTALGINPRGDIVGRYVDADGVAHGYLLSGDDFTSIDFPGATFTVANDINPRGDIVGFYTFADGVRHGFLLSGSSFTSIDFPGATGTQATGISPRGDIVGPYIDAGGVSHGFLLSGDDFIPFDFPDATSTVATRINPAGDITGSYTFADGAVCVSPQTRLCHGYLLSGSTFTSIDFPGATGTVPVGINPRGDIVGRYIDADGVTHGYLLSGDDFTSIDFPGAIDTQGWGINPRGDIVGRYIDAG